MSKSTRRNHAPAFKAKVALTAVKGEKTLAELAQQFDVQRRHAVAPSAAACKSDAVNRPRGRRRPDPFAAVTETLRTWFEAEPWRTSHELLDRLMTEHPDAFKAGQIRTLQRRIKTWRSEAAHRVVFGDEEPPKAELPETKHAVPALSEAP